MADARLGLLDRHIRPQPQGSSGSSGGSGGGRLRLALITTCIHRRSHAQHMGDRFLVGYPRAGKLHRPEIDLVSIYTDQSPASDLAPLRAAEFGVTIYPSIREALCCGGGLLAVDCVLIVGEHGEYEHSELGQHMYPRFEFFMAVAQVFRDSGRAVPVFNVRHPPPWPADRAKARPVGRGAGIYLPLRALLSVGCCAAGQAPLLPLRPGEADGRYLQGARFPLSRRLIDPVRLADARPRHAPRSQGCRGPRVRRLIATQICMTCILA